jgi:hypothetical protein
VPVIWVVEAKALPAYRLHLRFSDKTEGEVDLREFIMSDKRPVVEALRDEEKFGAIRVEMDTVVWDNGFDLAPEFLYGLAKAGTSA